MKQIIFISPPMTRGKRHEIIYALLPIFTYNFHNNNFFYSALCAVHFSVTFSTLSSWQRCVFIPYFRQSNYGVGNLISFNFA